MDALFQLVGNDEEDDDDLQAPCASEYPVGCSVRVQCAKLVSSTSPTSYGCRPPHVKTLPAWLRSTLQQMPAVLNGSVVRHIDSTRSFVEWESPTTHPGVKFEASMHRGFLSNPRARVRPTVTLSEEKRDEDQNRIPDTRGSGGGGGGLAGSGAAAAAGGGGGDAQGGTSIAVEGATWSSSDRLVLSGRGGSDDADTLAPAPHQVVVDGVGSSKEDGVSLVDKEHDEEEDDASIYSVAMLRPPVRGDVSPSVYSCSTTITPSSSSLAYSSNGAVLNGQSSSNSQNASFGSSPKRTGDKKD